MAEKKVTTHLNLLGNEIRNAKLGTDLHGNGHNFLGNATTADRQSIKMTMTYDGTDFAGTVDNYEQMSRYFMSIKPNAANEFWRVKFRVRVWIPVDTYKRFTDSFIEYSGYGITLSDYKIWNTVGNTYAVYYQTNYWLSAAGLTNGYGHAIGTSMASGGTNRTNPDWYRHVKVDVYDYEGCTVELMDSLKKWSEWEGGNATNYARGGTSPSTYNATTRGITMSGDRDTTYQLYDAKAFKVGDTAIPAYNPIGQDKNGLLVPMLEKPFLVQGPMYLYSGALSANLESSSYGLYHTIYNYQIRDGSSYVEGVIYKPLYLKGTIEDQMFTAVATAPYATALPDTDDGLYYYYLGEVTASTASGKYTYLSIKLGVHPVYFFKEGILRVYGSSSKWNELIGKPTTIAGYGITDAVTSGQLAVVINELDAKQDKLVSGTNIKTINSVSLLGSGNLSLVDLASAQTITGLKYASHGFRVANTIYGITRGDTRQTTVETILYTGIKWLSSTHMPILHLTGFAYGLQSPVELKIGFYIYTNKIGWCGVTNMGAWKPEVFLFKYSNSDGVDCVAVGLKGSCYYLQLSVDVQNETYNSGFGNIITDSSKWTWLFSTTAGVIPEAGADAQDENCVSVPYKADILSQAWSQITGKPTTLSGYGITDAQAKLVSGTNIKTIDNTSILGSGNIDLASTYLKLSGGTLTGDLTAKNIYPATSGTYFLGASDTPWARIFVGRVHSSRIESIGDLYHAKDEVDGIVDYKIWDASNFNPDLYALKSYVTTSIDAALASVLKYKGTVNANSDLPATHKVGWVYVVATDGTYVGKACEVGDYIICKVEGTTANNAHWDVVNGENQVADNNPTLSWGTKSKVATVDGTDIHVTMPANPNTDTKVTQTITESSNVSWRPLVLGYSYSDTAVFTPATVTNTVYASHLAKFQPSTGKLAIVGLNKMGTDGKLVTGSDTTVFNTNGGVVDLTGYLLTSTANSTFVKLSPGDAEQTISSNISSYSKGIVEFYRSSGDHIAFISFANKDSSGNKRTLGAIGFNSGGVGKLQYRDNNANYYDILHTGNISSLLPNYLTNYLKVNAVVQSTNPFTPLPGGAFYISKIDNAFYAADKRFVVSGELIDGDNVTQVSSAQLATLFNGDYEGHYKLTGGKTLKIHISFENQSDGRFPGYPYGSMYISFYYVYRPASVSARCYCNLSSQGVGWHSMGVTDLSNGTSNYCYRISNVYYAISEFEITIVGDTTNSGGYTGITELEMNLDRPAPSRNPFVSKYTAETLYYSLTAPSFIKTGGTASQFLKADGSVDSTAYLPLTGGTISGNLTINGSTTTKSIIPSAGSQYNLGTSDSWWNIIYGKYIRTSHIVNSDTDGNLYHDIEGVDTTVSYLIWDAHNFSPENYLQKTDLAAWAKAANKPSYTLDEVTDGESRKLSDYVTLTTAQTVSGVKNFSNGMKAKTLIIHGTTTANDTRFITSDATNNIYASIAGVTALVITSSEVRRGQGAPANNLGTPTMPWNNVYGNTLWANGGDVYVGSTAGSRCHQKYDSTNKCLKFIFD